MFKRFLSVVLAALIGAATPAVPAQAPSPAIERGLSVSAPVALPQLAQRLPDTIPPLYMLGGDDNIKPVASFNAATDPFPSAILSYSGPSLSTIFDSTGKLTYKPNNLLLQSNNFSNAAWTSSGVTLTSGQTDPLGGTNAWRLQGTTSTWLLYQNLSNINTNLVSYWVKSNTGSTQKVRLMLAGLPVGGDLNVTTSWTQISRTGVNNGSGSAGIIYDAAGDTVDILIYSAALSAVTYETSPRPGDQVITTASAYYGPRIDYDPNTLAVKGLLIEEARTNQNKSSADIAGTGWTAGAGVTIGSPTTSPDGTSNAKLYQSTGAADGLYNTAAVAIASPFASSLYLKYGGTGQWFVIRSYGTGGAQLWVDLLNGVIGTSSNYSGIGTVITPTLTAVNNGWYRIALGTSAGATHNYLQINSVDTDNSTVQANGSAYVWGAQTEPGSFATSYIPTAAASVTRAADVVQFTGAALTALQGSAWSFLVQMNDAPSATVPNSIWSGGNNSQHNATNSTIFGSFNGASYLNVTLPSGTFATAQRVGVATDGSTRTVASSGAKSTGAGGYPTALPNIYLGSFDGASYFVNGHFASFAIYDQRLPDATLQAKSVVNAPY